jgi:membrane protein DedA with SNARE-associated domain
VGITEAIAHLGTRIIGSIGYVGVLLLMTAESMVLPVPSEAVMPFAGFLVADHALAPVWVVVFATLGSIIGSLIGYAIGRFGGRPFVTRWGRYLLLDHRDLDWTDRFFQKRGEVTILVSRFIPIVRHLISIPAGMGRMRLPGFIIFTVLGAGLWNSFLMWCGYTLKRNWDAVMRYSHTIDVAVILILALLLALYIIRHLRRRAAGPPSAP